MSSHLFSPIRMNGVTLDNRIVVSPMGQQSGDGNGNATDWYIMHVGNLALSGAGLVIIEATGVEPRGRVTPNCIGLWNDENAAALEPVLAFCRRYGAAKMGIQLAHAGRKGSVSQAWKGQKPVLPENGGFELVSPSDVAYPGRTVPTALDHDGLMFVRDSFVKAAIRARDLNFDAIEVHNAHGYLLHSFLSPFANFRNDEYGGAIENRMRFPLEVFAAVRDVWPQDRILGIRVSATDWADGGWTIDDTIVFAEKLAALGCDYITASSGGATPDQNIPVGPGYQIPLAEAIKRAVSIPVMGVGLITEPLQAEEIILNGRADMVALGRGMLFNPRWPWHAAFALKAPIAIPGQYQRSHPDMRGGDFLKPRMD